MIDFNTYNLLDMLVRYRLRDDGYIYLGTADLFTREDLCAYDTLEELGILEQLWSDSDGYVEPIVAYYNFHEYPHILTPLGQAVMMYPELFVDNAFPS